MMKTAIYLLLAAGAFFLASACTNTVSKKVGNDCEPEVVIFPDIDQKDIEKTAISPNNDNLRKIKPGANKRDIVAQIGIPHFKEAFRAREWDYIFKMDDGSVCQYKIVFDRDRLARKFYWKPESCAAHYRQN